MGFLDKVKGAAQSAKDGIEKSGVVDKAKDAVNTKLHPDEAPAEPPTDEQLKREWESVTSAMARGGMDPRPLLTIDEVQSVLGVSGLRLTLGGAEDELSADFMDVGRTVGLELMCHHAYDESEPFLPAEAYENLVGNAMYGLDQSPVDGLGDRASVGGGMCAFIKGDKVFLVNLRGIEDGTEGPKAVELARKAAARV
jgi:hypothetical protein